MAETEIVLRVKKVERGNRWMRRLSGVALVLAAALSVMYARRPGLEKITAREFDVVGASGKTRIRLSVQKDGTASVILFDHVGVAQVAMDVSRKYESSLEKPVVTSSRPNPIRSSLPLKDERIFGYGAAHP